MPIRGPKTASQRTLAQRLGRVLERVTRQSGRLQETPAYGSLLLGRVSESQKRRRVRIQIILTIARHGGECDRNRRRRAAGDGRHSRTEHLRRRAGVDHIRRDARLRHLSPWPWALTGLPGGRCWRCAGRSRSANPPASTSATPSLAPWRVAIVDLGLWGVGTIAVHDPLRPGQHAVHPAVSVRGRAFAAFWSPPPPT